MRCANAALHGTHLVIILFTTLGWLVPAWRPAQLVLCALILLSWFGFGIPSGKPGMCLVTELQKKLWCRMGIEDRDSYMVYLLEQITGKRPDPTRTEVATQATFYASAVISLVLFLR
jgi:hypothetical protein